MSEHPGDALPSALRAAHQALKTVDTANGAARQAMDLLERDLLPRSAGGAGDLVVGIVGPNNAGKSALFNALAGRRLSPSIPTGGATRRLIAAAHPDLLDRLKAEPSLARFRLRELLAPDPDRPDDSVLLPAEDPTEVVVARVTTLPPGLMLIDTPDFDSILADNRLVSESLLTVADLVIVVVTRHSYQNREVVGFLQRWLGHARPWLLVYNEGGDAQVAAGHVAKLAADVGTPPLAAFWAPHSLDVQRGTSALDPTWVATRRPTNRPTNSPTNTPTNAPTHLTIPADGRLRTLLFQAAGLGELKARAFQSALARLRDDLEATAASLDLAATQARDVLGAAESRAQEAGVRVASTAMPGGPFIEAFRHVLDRRSNPVSRGWRAAVRQVRVRLESLPSLFRRGAANRTREQAGESLAAIEKAQLGEAWPVLWENLVRDLGQEARHPARATAPAELVQLLDGDLADRHRADARLAAEGQLVSQSSRLDAFREACEQLVDQAIEDRGFDIDIQAITDLVTVIPLAVAAAVIVKTGGLGIDVAVAGGGAVSTFIADRYVHLAGASVVADARRSWASLRGRELAQILLVAALPQSLPELRRRAARDSELAGELRALRQRCQMDRPTVQAGGQEQA